MPGKLPNVASDVSQHFSAFQQAIEAAPAKNA